MRFGIITFPGSNCDHDMRHVLGDVLHQELVEIWHRDTHLHDLTSADCVVLPGGFSYGDYIRAGAIAHLAPVMKAVKKHASNGGLVLGICNGFQILCESGLLPGALVRNANQQFIGRDVYLCVETSNSLITHHYAESDVLCMPIAHAEGRYIADEETLDDLTLRDQILFTYCSSNGERTPSSDVNGSMRRIAGICNEGRNVFGMMPHPERAAESILGNTDGLALFQGLIAQPIPA